VEGRVVIEAARYDRDAFNTTWEALGGATVLEKKRAVSGGTLYRWTVDPSRGSVSEAPLDDLAVDFPVIRATRVGREHRYTYATSLELLSDQHGSRIVKYDRSTGSRTSHDLEKGWVSGEVTFVHARGATSEDDGWLLAIVTHDTLDAARFLILAASNLAAPPVATLVLPRHVPSGFHGTWIREADLH
jgi:carotenoid cleavage dioxygenase-like enzyme